MENAGQTAEALNQRIDRLCDDLMNRFLRIVACAAGDQDTSLSTTAQNELSLVDHVTAFKRSVEELSSLIRELQELWLFGSLDTLTDPGDEAARRERTLKAAREIQELVKQLPDTSETETETPAEDSEDSEEQEPERSQSEETDYQSTHSHTVSPATYNDMTSPDTMQGDTSPETMVASPTPFFDAEENLPSQMNNMRFR